MPQWLLTDINSSTGTRSTSFSGNRASTSTFVISMDLQRRSFFIIRLVVLPLMAIVMLSWSVFWMDKSSLGDRISVSFIGILTAVSYQMLLGEILPRISYLTLMNGFLNISFMIMCLSVIINLRVGYLDHQGRGEAGNQLDHRCRWMFPVFYFGYILVITGISLFLLPPL